MTSLLSTLSFRWHHLSTAMANSLLVRNLDPELVAKLKQRAVRNGRSAEAEHREILRRALEGEEKPDFATLAAEMRRITANKETIPSEVLLREMRDER